MLLGAVGATPAFAKDDDRDNRGRIDVRLDIRDVRADNDRLHDLECRRDLARRHHDWDEVRSLTFDINQLRLHIDYDRRHISRDIRYIRRDDRGVDRDRYRDGDRRRDRDQRDGDGRRYHRRSQDDGR